MSVNRYRQMLASVPTGNFYASDGQVIPYKGVSPDARYQIRITTPRALHEYGVYVNDTYVFAITTDSSGVALISVSLLLGKNIIKLVALGLSESVSATITTREYATMLAAAAESIESIDSGAAQVLADSRLATSSAALIEQAFGEITGTRNSTGYDLETYRELLQELRVAYRHYGSTLEGINRVVRAFTQISPLYKERDFGPQWVLGRDFIRPHTNTSRTSCYPGNAGGTTWTSGPTQSMLVTSVSDKIGYIGTGYIKCYRSMLSLKRYAQFGSVSGSWGAPVEITGNGTYTLYDHDLVPSMVGELEPYDIRTDANDRLALEFGNKGILIVQLAAGGARTAAQIATEINSAFNSDTRYGAAYSAVASSFTSAGGRRLKIITSAFGETSESITIHPVTSSSVADSGDAAQTLFNLAPIRAGLREAVSAGDTYLPLDAATDMTTWPTHTTDDRFMPIMIGRSTHQFVGSSIDAVTTINPTYADVAHVDVPTKTLMLGGIGILDDYDAGTLVEVCSQLPYVISPISNMRSITVNISDYTLITTTDAFGEFNIGGSSIPDGWYQTDSGGIWVAPPSHPSMATYFSQERDLATLIDDQTYTYIPVDDSILEYKGFNAKLSVFASPETYGSGTNVDITSLAMSFDGGSTWSSGSPTITGTVISSINKPRKYDFDVIVSPSATKCVARIQVGSGTIPLTLHKVIVTIPEIHDGLFLHRGTTPRHETKVKSSGFIYVWCKDVLSTAESDQIGVSTSDQNTRGHIDKIAPAKLWLDKYNVTDMAGITLYNIAGSFSNAEWSAGTSTNMDVVLRSPNRFTYLKPVTISEHLETVTWSSTNKYSVEFSSNQTGSILFADGIPMEAADWQWNSSTEIEILSVPSQVLIYQIKYYALIRHESSAIDLGTRYADCVWYADYHAFTRPDVMPVEYPVDTGVQFDGNGLATLSDRHSGIKTQAQLIEDNGSVKRTIAQGDWSFYSPNQIQINLAEFNSNALYSFSYVALIPDPTPSVNVLVELRSASTPVGLSSATYYAVSQNQVVNATHRYHQMRATISNVRDTRDIRLQSLLLKGLNAFGTGGTIPLMRG